MKIFQLWGMLCVAVSVVFASCSNDEFQEVPTPVNEVKEVSLTTSLNIASRAALDEEELELFYTVYRAADGSVVAKNTTGLNAVSFQGNTSVTLTLQLEENQSYDIAFWAQAKGLDCYDLTDIKAIKLHYDRCRCNDNSRQAYYGSLIGFRVTDGATHATVSLKSPFGKLQVLTTVHDVEVATSMGIPVGQMDSSLYVRGVADTFNALHGTTEGEAVCARLLPGAVPAQERDIDGTFYRVLTSDFLLAHDRATLDVEVSLSYTNIERQPLVFTAGRAWLTRGEVSSLSGRYLTHPIEFDASVSAWKEADTSIAL